MANGRHSYIAFYPSDWLGGTARMRSRIMRSIYFDICLYNWDMAKACPLVELAAMLGDVTDWQNQIDQLIAMEKLVRNDDGSVENLKAMAEARKSMAAWEAMSRGGKERRKGHDKGASKGDESPHDIPASTEPEPEPKLDDANASSPTKRGKRLPDGWEPDRPYPASVAELTTQWPEKREARELDQFRDYWSTRTRDAARLDWNKTWHNRIRDQHDRIMREANNGRTNGMAGNRQSGGASSDGFTNAIREARAIREANRG